MPAEFAQALRELGLAGAGETLLGRPLTGGVSSDIWRIDTARGPVCAKRALAKLRVAADWRAPIERNRYEARWMQVAQAASPGCTAAVLGQHPRLGVLVMSYLEPSRYVLWKQALRDGHADPDTARAVGARAGAHPRVLGRAARSSRRSSRPTRSSSTSASSPTCWRRRRAIRTWRRALEALVKTTQANTRALVHGDVSPKNILVGADGPVLLDAECAWWGDPAFDIAFCLNHLLLKCLWMPAATAAFLASFEALSRGLPRGVDWEPRDGARAARGGAAAGPVAGAGRRQVAGRIPHRRGRPRAGAPRRRGAARRTR